MSKQRPSAGISLAAAATQSPLAHWRRRIFKNSYTRRGRTFRLEGWSVKIQREGRRCTFSLHGRTKDAAAAEAKALHDAVVAQGWAAASRLHSAWPGGGVEFSKSDVGYWREKLLHRRYRFPASPQADQDLTVQIEHAGAAWYFPLGTPDADKAAAKAHAIYWKAAERGWDAAMRTFPREAIVGLVWSVHPLVWTYTTIHTIAGPQTNGVANASPAPGARRVLILEPEAGVARALAWCVDQHPGFCAVIGDSSQPLSPAINAHQPSLMLLNRNLGERFGFPSPGQLAASRDGVPALMYSVCADGDKLFVSTPGGAQGYFLKRVPPERLLEPVMEMAGRAAFSADDLLGRVRSQFKELLRSRADEDATGLSKLTRREREVLTLMSRGGVDKEIARILGISIWTVHGHIKSIFERLQVRTRTEAVVRYLEK